MNLRIMFLMLFSLLVASYVHCARELNSWIESKYKECYLLNEKRSSLKRAPSEVVDLDRICLAKDDTYKYVSCPLKFPIEFPFDNVKIIRMDNHLMVLYARLIDLNRYATAEIEFEEHTRAENFFEKFLGQSVIKRKKIIDIAVLEKIGKMSPPAVSLYREYEFQYDVQLNFIEHEGEKIFIVEKSAPFLVFSEKNFQLSRVINEQFIVMSVEGFADLFYILGFNKPGKAKKFRNEFIENALKKDEFKFPKEIDQFVGA